METQNITLALPKKTLVRIKVIAAQQQTSVSALLTKALTQLAEQEEAYGRARRRHMRQLEHAADLGTHGRLKLKREDLHERR
ncbi:MAG: CopG family transcriptional regulator [Chloroflexi bacterium]|nr:CopG family transcriptional regulator [Chloroflexota bacterium]